MPRPSTRESGAIWRLLEEWSASHPLNPNQRQIAGLLEVSESLLSAWKLRQSVIQSEDIELIAKHTGFDEERVRTAAEEDKPASLEYVTARRKGGSGRKRRRSTP